MSGPRFYPALDVTWSAPPASDVVDRLLADLDESSPTAVEDRPDGIRLFFLTTADCDRAISLAALAAPDARLAALAISDEAWAERSQAALRPVTVGRITIAPPWTLESEEATKDASPIVIAIQPSMGFGTGHHQSTRLCLRCLQDHDLSGQAVLDVGTGSGVLALAAWRLGARHVTALDSDPDAVTAARENLERNGAAGHISLDVADINRTAGAFAGRFDLVLANLTGGALTRLAPQLTTCAVEAGAIITSGFQRDEVAEVVKAFRAAGTVVDTTLHEDSWAAVRFTRVSASPSETTAH